MTEVCNITHEVGDLSEYDSTQTDSGDLSVGRAGGLANTFYGLVLLIDDTNTLFAEKAISLATNEIRLRFYLDPNSLSISSGGQVMICDVRLSAYPWRALAVVLYDVSGVYKIRAFGITDAGGLSGVSAYDITDAPHYIECHLQRAANSGSSDGTLDLWIDGVHKEQKTGIDNYDIWSDIDGIALDFERWAGTISGTFYMDELRANDDGGEIGPEYGIPPKRRRMEDC